MDEGNIITSGIAPGGEEAKGPEQIPPPITASEFIPETIVVPPSGADSSPTPRAVVTPPDNPFIPQGVTSQPSQTTTAPAGVPGTGGKKSGLRKIILFLVLAVVLLGAVFLGKTFLGNFAVSQPVTLIYWGLWENESILIPVITEFESQNPQIKVEYVKQSPRQYRERLQAAMERGEGPDIFRFHNTWVPMLRKELAVAPVNIVSSAEIAANFYPVVAADLVGGSNVYGIPMMIDGLGLYYNEDLLSAAGVSPPTTWPELLEAVPKLTVKTGETITTSAIALGTTNNVEHFSDILATMLLQNGAKLISPTGKEAEEALIFFRKFAEPSDPVYTWNETLDNSLAAFANGRVAMILAPSWRALEVKQLNPNLHFKIAPIPQLPGVTITWASYWVEGVSAKSKNTQQAWEFAKFLASRNSVTKLFTAEAKVRLFGEPYALKELGSSLKDDPFLGAYIQQAATAKSFPLASRTFDNGLNDKLIKYLEDAVNGLGRGSSPQAVLETMNAGFRQVLASYGLSTGVVPTSP